MRKVAFLSQDDMGHYVSDDDLALPAFAEQGLAVDTVSWRANDIPWSAYDAVIVRSTWDYQRAPQAFFERLDAINEQTRLANPLELMRWNMVKTYLGELAGKGVAVVPTEYGESLQEKQLNGIVERFPQGFVIKPVISGGAEGTYRVFADSLAEQKKAIIDSHRDGRWMLQPYLANIVEQGEYSLFFFAGEYSHCIVKRPKTGDFRVQEEHGGLIEATEPLPGMRKIAKQVLATAPTKSLYARVDLVSDGEGQWLLIELEVIEPSMYLRKSTDGCERFARAAAAWLDSE